MFGHHSWEFSDSRMLLLLDGCHNSVKNKKIGLTFPPIHLKIRHYFQERLVCLELFHLLSCWR